MSFELFCVICKIAEACGICIGTITKDPYLMIASGIWLIIMKLMDIEDCIKKNKEN